MDNNDRLTLEYVRNYLRVDDYGEPEEDRFIQQMILASKSFVETYLNRKFSDFEGGYPDEFDIARLNLISQWYDTRAIITPRSNVKELDFVFSGLLNPHRFIKLGFVGKNNGRLGSSGNDGLNGMYYDESTGLFYRANIVDTYTSVTGDDDLSHAPNTSFTAPIDSVDYNQKEKRGN